MENQVPSELRLSYNQYDEMKLDASRRFPEEACGLLAGLGKKVLEVIRITNELHSPYRFRMEPGEQIRALQSFEERGLELIAIYHSHPHGPERPSATDVAEAAYPEAVNLIWSAQGGEWRCRGFLIRDGMVQEVKLTLTSHSDFHNDESNE